MIKGHASNDASQEPPTYFCEECLGTFEYEDGWTDEDARAEAAELWTPEENAMPQAVACDDCFQEIRKRMGR